MQKTDSNKYLFSPSDLTTFLACHHASFLDVKSLSEDLTKKEQDSSSKLLQEKGIEHEKAYLQKLKIEGKSVCEIDQDLPINDRVSKTTDAIKSGYDVIYQAVLKNDNWQGFADFLIKCDTPSNLGNYSYGTSEIFIRKLYNLSDL